MYDVNDKNAFIYRLVKEDIEVIDLDSDNETPAPSTGRIIQIDSKVIDIPSDSDSEYSGDECLQNIEEIDEQSSCHSDELSDDFEENSSDDTSETDESDEDANFVVTNTILTCGTPTETIALDEDSSASEREAEAQPSEQPKQTEKNKDSNGAISEEPSTSEAAAQANQSSDIPVEDKPNENTSNIEQDKTVESSTKDETTRLANLKRRIAGSAPRTIAITKAQPLKKRRETLTEVEYHARKQDKKRMDDERKQKRRELLAAMGDKEKAKRDAAAELAAEPNRVPFVPKVKITTATRAEQLCTDMLALDSTSTTQNLP